MADKPPQYPQQTYQQDAGPYYGGPDGGANRGYYDQGGYPPPQQGYGPPQGYYNGPPQGGMMYGPPQGAPVEYREDRRSGAGGCCAGIAAALACCCCLDCLF